MNSAYDYDYTVKSLFRFAVTLFLLAIWGQAASAAERITYIHTDILGSPVAASAENGDLAWRAAYLPYGEKSGGSGFVEETAYTGHQFDRDTGLTYALARHYDPIIGKFLGTDSVGFGENNLHSFNRYTYASNNPYKFIDPDGRESYLVSRPLSFTKFGNHNFVVTNADYLGDPDATIYSFGDIGNDTMGRVTKDTKGFSKGTFASDYSDWTSLRSKNKSVTYRKIDADDETVDQIAGRVETGLQYNLVPEIQGGVNSNTAAGAIAKKADGGLTRVQNWKLQPGNRVTDRIKFLDEN